MNNSKEKNFTNKTTMIVSIILLSIIIVILSCILLFKNHNTQNINNFEKIAIYGYIGNSLNVNELYSLSGSSSYDPLTSAIVEIKNFLENYTTTNNTDTVPANMIPNTNNIDYHGVLISDYEYIPEQNVFKKSIGVNSNMKSVESSYNSHSNELVSVTDIKKLSDSSYEVSFNIVDSFNKDFILNSGIATIEINEDNTFNVVSCSLEK